jgi:hypothetical protein
LRHLVAKIKKLLLHLHNSVFIPFSPLQKKKENEPSKQSSTVH